VINRNRSRNADDTDLANPFDNLAARWGGGTEIRVWSVIRHPEPLSSAAYTSVVFEH
jgi:hypothetical protein